jgi:hypothetical protein
MIRACLLLLPVAVAGASCGSFINDFADMHDGDVKNVTVSEAGSITISQDAPVQWTLTTALDLATCTAMVDFSKSKKPAHPPVPLQIAIKQTTVGTMLLEFTDPSGTLNPDRDYPLNIWTTEKELPAVEKCAVFAGTPFQDMHDGDVKIVSVSDGMLSMGQAGIWNLTTPLDLSTCRATVDFSKSDKPAKPPVPLVVSVAVASGNDKTQSVIMTWTDPTKTISPSASFPLNMWEGVKGR